MKAAFDLYAGARHNTKSCGELVVVAYHSYEDICVEFVETGSVIHGVNAANLRRGNVWDPLARTVLKIGFLGSGPFSLKYHKKAYARWVGMLERVYRPKTPQMKRDYEGCSVDGAWHNFQSFAEWHEKQVFAHSPGYELDKDLRVFGNRLYSRRTCQIIPKELNSLIGRSRRQNSFGVGVCRVRSTGRFTSIIRHRGHLAYLGTFDTGIEAERAYLKAHYSRLLVLANELRASNRITAQQQGLVQTFVRRSRQEVQ